MNGGILLLTILCLLTGVFVFKKLWLGGLVSIIIIVISKVISHSSFDSFTVPLSSSFLISVELILLLFGAFLFYNILSSNGHFNEFVRVASSFSSKISIVLILCLFMGSFMEGIAGFGIPAMLIAPLMLVLGFRALTSVVLSLVANTISVPFGALGTPLKIGLGIYTSDATVIGTIIINSLPALIMPFILAYIYGKIEQIKIEWGTEWKILLGAGLCFLVPYAITGSFSIEYPSVVAGVFGLISFVVLFIPQKENPSLAFWVKSFYPYFMFVLLLIIAKYFLEDSVWEVKENLKPISFYQPGAIFILAGILYLFQIRRRQMGVAFSEQSKRTFFILAKPIITIVLLVCITQLIQHDVSSLANHYYSDLSIMSQLVITPIMGVLGSFITSSATMSNLLLSNGVRTTSANLPILLALLHIGSAIGNALSFQNILMVKTVVNNDLTEAIIMKYTVGAVFLYCLIVIISVIPLLWINEGSIYF